MTLINRLSSVLKFGPTILLGLGLTGCPNPDMHGSLYENAGAAFAQCNTSEIKHMAERHNMMAAFKFCGSNNFKHYAWSPTGELLFFDLPLTANVMDAGKKEKPLYRLPIELPSGQSAWINQQKIAYPIAGSKDAPDDVPQIGLFDTFQHTLDYRKISGLTDIDELQKGVNPSELYFTATDPNGHRTIYLLDLDDGSVKQAFDWLKKPFYPQHVESFTFTPEANTVVIGHKPKLGKGKPYVSAYQADTGKSLGHWPASRGVMHPEGQWLALEHLGEPVSVFYQRRWEKQKGRAWDQEQARVEDLEQNLPDWYDPHIQLPTFSFVQMETGKRWSVRSFFGSQFRWYPPINARAKFYGSFILWGFEGKQVNRNVVLGDMSPTLFDMLKNNESNKIEEMEQTIADLYRLERSEADSDRNAGAKESNSDNASTTHKNTSATTK